MCAHRGVMHDHDLAARQKRAEHAQIEKKPAAGVKRKFHLLPKIAAGDAATAQPDMAQMKIPRRARRENLDPAVERGVLATVDEIVDGLDHLASKALHANRRLGEKAAVNNDIRRHDSVFTDDGRRSNSQRPMPAQPCELAQDLVSPRPLRSRYALLPPRRSEPPRKPWRSVRKPPPNQRRAGPPSALKPEQVVKARMQLSPQNPAKPHDRAPFEPAAIDRLSRHGARQWRQFDPGERSRRSDAHGRP